MAKTRKGNEKMATVIRLREIGRDEHVIQRCTRSEIFAEKFAEIGAPVVEHGPEEPVIGS